MSDQALIYNTLPCRATSLNAYQVLVHVESDSLRRRVDAERSRNPSAHTCRPRIKLKIFQKHEMFTP